MLFFLSLVSIFLLGYLAQSTGLCMVRGVKKAQKGSPMFLVAILMSGTLAWVSMSVGLTSETQSSTIGFWPSFFSLGGGVLFGIGAAANSGCGVSTVSRLARGETVMLVTIIGWFIAWLLFVPILPLELKGEAFLIGEQTRYFILGSTSLAIAVACFFMGAKNRKLWLSMLGVGLMAGLVFIYEPHWTPSGLLKSVSGALWSGDSNLWPEQERFILILCLLVGMVTAAVWTRSFEFRLLSFRQAVRHLLAGILMGLGAVMAGGGNDTQLLVAMPIFSPAGFTTVACIVLGIYFGIRWIPTHHR